MNRRGEAPSSRSDEEHSVDDPKPDAAPIKPAKKQRAVKDTSPFSSAGRELTDDELDRIVGGQ